MTLDAGALKRRYQQRWRQSNARERFVLLFLRAFLPEGFEARLTGLGAGEDRLIERSYGSLEEAFDITIYWNGAPLAFVDVTGVPHSSEAKPGLGYCVGRWKLEKAERHGVLDRFWVAFVIEGESTILWAPASKFHTSAARPARLYEDEQEVLCMPRRAWHPWHRPRWVTGKIPFLDWLRLTAATNGPLKKLAGVR